MRPNQFKRGGGFLNGVDATIVGYTFFVGETGKIKKGDRKGEDFTPLSLVPEFRQDGADDTVSQRLLIGDAPNFGDVSEDGLTLTIGEGRIPASSEAAVFIESLVEGGFPAENFDEDETTWNVEPIIGTRVRLIQEVNAAKTKRQGPQIGKNGKPYDRRDLKVATVHDLPTAKVKTNGAAKTPTKGVKAAKAAKGPDVSALAAATVMDILSAQDDNQITKAKLKMRVFAAFSAKHPQRDQRDAVIEYLKSDENLASLEDIDFDGTTLSA